MTCSVCFRFQLAVSLPSNLRRNKKRSIYAVCLPSNFQEKQISLSLCRPLSFNFISRRSLFDFKKIKESEKRVNKFVALTQHCRKQIFVSMQPHNLQERETSFLRFRINQVRFGRATKTRKSSSFRFPSSTIKKNRTIEMTWGETADAQLKV